MRTLRLAENDGFQVISLLVSYSEKLSEQKRIRNYMRITLLIIAIVPFFLLGGGILRPELLVGESLLSASLVWTLVGALFGFYGFVFSAFAVLEVRSLSSRYLAKQRLPELKSDLTEITDAMISFSDRKIEKLRTERFMGKISVVLKQVKKTKAGGFSPICKRAEAEHDAFNKILKVGASLDQPASDFQEYFDLMNTLHEMADEIEAYKKEAQASL